MISSRNDFSNNSTNNSFSEDDIGLEQLFKAIVRNKGSRCDFKK